jgi:hypothetical protein
MSRRLSGVCAAALALSLSLSSCSGGGDEPSSSGRTKGTDATHAPTAPSYGEPGVASAAEAFAVLREYSKRNNALIRKYRATPHKPSIWSQVDAGILLATDRFAAKAVNNGWDFADFRSRYSAPARVYAPASKTWPKEVAVAARQTRLEPTKESRPDGPGTVELVVLRQAAEGAPWKKVAGPAAARASLPQAAAIGADSVPTEAQRARALELARELPAYWATGRKPAGFADVKRVDEPRTTRDKWLKAHEYRDVRYRARLAGDAAVSARTFRVQGGSLVVASYRLWTTWVANSTIHWTEGAASVWGGGSHPRLTGTKIAQVAFFVPDDGPAHGVGYDDGYALF